MILEVAIEPAGPGAAVVTLRGQLTLGTSLKVAETQVSSLLDGGTTSLVLDLRQVPFMDSAGLGVVVFLFGRATELGGRMRLVSPSERVAAMLRMTRTDTLIPTDPDVSTSLKAFAL